MSITYQIFVCSIKAHVFAGAMNIHHFLLDIFYHLIGRNIFFVKLQKLSFPVTLFILKFRIAILNRNMAISWFNMAISWFKITNTSLMLTFIFLFGLFMSPLKKTFLMG